MSIELVMPSNHLILCCLLLLPSIFPSIRVFPMSRLFASGGQSTGVSASASFLSVNIQDSFPLGLTGLISLLSKGLSRVFSKTSLKASILQRSASIMIQLSHLYMTTGKTIALTIWTFAGQVEVYLYSETQWRARLGSLHFALFLHNADNLFYVPCFGGLSWATLGRLEIGNKRTSADKRVFQGLESPGKTKKGKHQINKENGSCQQESAKQQRCRKTSSTSSPGGRLKHHPPEAKEGRKPQADRCALLIRKRSGSPQLCRHFGTLTAQDTWCQTLCSGSRLWLTHWESTEGPGLLPKQTGRSSLHMKKARAGEREGERDWPGRRLERNLIKP